MRKLFRWSNVNSSGREGGIALAVVIGISAILLLLVTTSVTFSVSAETKSSTDSDWNAAMSAAYAGVSDYQARLTNDNTYQKYGDSTAPFSASTGSTTLALPTGANANPAFGWGVSGTWAAIGGAAGNAAYRYEVDNSQYASQGILRVLATGRSGNQTRSVVANIHQKGFLDYLYFTDYETQDPSLIGTSQANCTQYYPTRIDNQCGGAIQFGSGEVINGPLRSNDALYICSGATFNGTVTSNYKTPPFYRDCGAANFNQGVPVYSPTALKMPPTNSNMKQETRSDLTGTTVPRPGCLYTGPTTIRFNGDGTMTVRSPWTIFTNTTATGGTLNPACGIPGTTTTTTNTLGSSTGQTLNVPVQNLIYVQSVPVNTPADPNYWGSKFPPNLVCPTNGNGLGFPINTATPVSGGTLNTKETILTTAVGPYYGCQAGDAFVSQKIAHGVSGQVTIYADNYIWVTSDLQYKNPATDVLGLVGNGAVWVWNPYGTTQTCAASSCGTKKTNSLLTDTGREIDAAILSENHTFQVQNFNKGSTRGALTVLGAIAQEYRGTVGQPPIGYTKNYTYDRRFRSIAPPKFLQAVSTTYGISQFAEVPAAFAANGTVK
jgi:hypothetical protein